MNIHRLNRIDTLMMPPAKSTKKIGLTPTQKYDLCCLRSRYPKMKLVDFALLDECPRRADGSPLAVSSLSDHLKGWAAKVKDGRPQGM